MCNLRAKKQNQGFTLMELVIGAGLIAIVVLGLISVVVRNYRLDAYVRENTVAANTLRHVAVALEAYATDNAALNQLYSMYGGNAPDTADVNIGYTGVPGEAEDLSVDTLEEQGLNQVVVYTNNRPVLITFFPDEANNIYTNADLNGDGDSTDNKAAWQAAVLGTDPVILPARLTLQWQGVNAPSENGGVSTYSIDVILGGN